MWRFAVCLIGACWTGPVAPIVETPAQADTCVIREHDVETGHEARLSVGGKRFASIAGAFTRLAVTFEPNHARARVETEAVELTGELDRASLPVRPARGELHDGWLRIESAVARAARAGRLRVDVTLPDGFAPAHVLVDLACGALTFAAPPERPEEPEGAQWIEFVAGTRTAVARTPAGPAVTTIAPVPTPATDPRIPQELTPVAARVLERRGKHLRIQIAGETSIVEGWISSEHTRDQITGGLGGFGFGRSGISPNTITCARAIPIYVDAGGAITRVGRYKRDASIVLADRSAVDRVDRIVVNLGDAEVAPFVRRSDVTECL